jgi:hypothetical protein
MLSPPTFVVAGAASAAECGMASRRAHGLAGTLVSFRHAAEPVAFPIWRSARLATPRSNGPTMHVAARSQLVATN